MKDILHQLYGIIDEYIDNNEQDNPVVYFQNPEQIREKVFLPITKEGEGFEDLFKHMQRYLRYSVKTGNKQFYNQLYGGFNLPAFMGDVLTSLTNTSMYTYEVAPVATMIELELIRKMNAYTGFNDGDGLFLTGGSNSNLVAMFTARNQKYPEIKKIGVYNHKALVAFVSDQAHYSMSTAANMLGLGVNNLRKVKSDKYGKMIPAELEREIQEATERGEEPFFVAATTGTTMTGAFDSVEEIADISQKYKLWLHVDGSFGGSLILSQKHRHLFNGIECADSFAWNPHKLMNIPLVCSVILVKQKGVLHQNYLDLQDADYLFHENNEEDYDLGRKSAQCGRRVDALKLWLSWKFHGDLGYEKRLNHLVDMASYVEQQVIDSQKLELMVPRQSLTVCFRYRVPEGLDKNSFNKYLRDNLRKSGKSSVNYGFIDDELAIRLVLINPEVQKEDLDKFLVYLGEVGDNMLKN